MKIIQLEPPEQFDTPDWVKYFIDFICSKSQEEWEEKQKTNNYNF